MTEDRSCGKKNLPNKSLTDRTIFNIETFVFPIFFLDEARSIQSQDPSFESTVQVSNLINIIYCLIVVLKFLYSWASLLLLFFIVVAPSFAVGLPMLLLLVSMILVSERFSIEY